MGWPCQPAWLEFFWNEVNMCMVELNFLVKMFRLSLDRPVTQLGSNQNDTFMCFKCHCICKRQHQFSVVLEL